MKIGPFQTLALVEYDQLRGKILTMPDGDSSEYYLVEIIEEKKHRKDGNVGCKVLVAKDKVIKYTKKSEGEKSEVQAIFDQFDVVAQYKNRDDEQVFKYDTAYSDSVLDGDKPKTDKKHEVSDPPSVEGLSGLPSGG